MAQQQKTGKAGPGAGTTRTPAAQASEYAAEMGASCSSYPHLRAVTQATEVVERGPCVHRERVWRACSALVEVEVDNVANLLATAVHIPVVPVERQRAWRCTLIRACGATNARCTHRPRATATARVGWCRQVCPGNAAGSADRTRRGAGAPSAARAAKSSRSCLRGMRLSIAGGSRRRTHTADKRRLRLQATQARAATHCCAQR